MVDPTTTTSGAKPTAEPRRPLPLGTRIFLITGALVALAVGAAILLTSLRAERIARGAAAESLTAARAAMAAWERERYTQLALMSRLVAGDPNFVAYVAESDPASVRDLLEERRAGLGCDIAIVVDREGRVLARTDRGGALDPTARALLTAAAEKGEASGMLREGERLYYAAAVPMVSGSSAFEGLLVAGFAVDDARALEMKRLGTAEVAYLAGTDPPRVVASTLAGGPAAVERALAPRRDALRRALERPGGAPFSVSAEGRRWEVLAEPLRDAAGAPVGALVGLASLDPWLAPFRRIVSELTLLGLLVVAAAFALSWRISRRVTRPLEELAVAAEAAREGRFGASVDVGRDDEVGRLARAFDGLLSDLREKRDMETFVTRLARNLPEPTPGTPAAAPAEDGAPLAPGSLFAGRFEVLSVLGAGGMGVVYKARDRDLGDLVALKTLKPGLWRDPEALERLKSELRLARRITHPNVLRTYDFGESEGRAFISMEYVRGVTLRYLLDQTGRLPYSAGLRLARQLGAGLEAAHEVGVLHRDIKPENLIVEQTGEAKLMDFGIARPTRGGANLTVAGAMIGTPRYMSPEQLQGREPDARADLYACGVVLFETFTGALPYAGDEPYALAYKQMNEPPRAPRDAAPELPESLEAIILRCLEREPARRYGSARELLGDLEGLRA